MSHETDPLPIASVTLIETLNDANPNQSLFYSSDWSASNNLPIPSVLQEWATPTIPSVSGKAYLYIKSGSTDLFFSTATGGEQRLSTTSGGGTISGPISSTANAIVRWNGTTGAILKNSAATIDDSGTITATSYAIGGSVVLSSTALGSSVTGSSLTSATSMNIATGQSYSIGGTAVLSATSLGTAVVSSSLTSVGVLAAGSIGGAFGTINIGANALTCGSVSTTSIACNTISANQYLISSTVILSSTTLGSSIVNSSLTSLGIQAAGVNIATGTTYKINSTAVLSATTLGSSVVNSSLALLGSSVEISGVGLLFDLTSNFCLKHKNYVGSYQIYMSETATIISNTTSVSMQYLSGNSAVTLNSSGITLKSSSNFIFTDASNVTIASISQTGNAVFSLVTCQSLICNSTSAALVPPVLTTTQKNAISSPTIGSILYDVTTNFFQVYNGSWINIGSDVVLTTAAQTNITSLGQLTGLAVGGAANSSAIVTIASTTKGLLPPVMTTTQKNAIATPATGLLVFDSTLATLNQYTGSAWASFGGSASNAVVTSITNTDSPYTLATSTDILVCTASSGAITITLPTAVGNSGKVFRIVRTDTTIANAITINSSNGVQTIGGVGKTSRKMYTANECWEIISDGAVWQVIDHSANTDWISDGVVIITATGGGYVKGTLTIDITRWRRIGKQIEVHSHTLGSSTSANGTGNYLVSIPQSSTLTIDSATILFNNTVDSYANNCTNIGEFSIADGGTNTTALIGWGTVIPYDATRVRGRYSFTRNNTDTPQRTVWGNASFPHPPHTGIALRYSVPITQFDE